MWVLESSSELFQGRRMWLKPGKSYLFGRVQKDGVRFAIDNKTISRKHFIIKVDDVRLEDVGNIHARTKLTIEDQNSKAGTHVNGEHIKGSSKELKNEENYIKPGSLPEDLMIKWHPFVLTFNLLKKEVKAGLLKTKQERVRELDIKVIGEYIPGQTTHLVVNKRNTPKSLQALIDGKPLVAESYIDSLEYAATPSDLNEEENLSPLEQDFDSAWPIAYDHLPPPGREPTLRPAEAYKPDKMRRNVFEHFTFVFLDQNQYDNLLPPITTGHGKALLCRITTGETITEELITFLRNAAGQKGFGDEQKDTDKGGVILVRYKGDAGAEDWINTLINETSLRLDQRAIDQGEFLDAILANDAMLLRQAVPFESHPDGSLAQTQPSALNARADGKAESLRPPGSQLTLRSQASNYTDATVRGNSKSPIDQHAERRQLVENEALEPNARAAPFAFPKKSRVLDFDDDFDPDSVVPYNDDEASSPPETSHGHRDVSLLSAGNEGNMAEEQATPSRKRFRSKSKESDTGLDDSMDDLLPAAAAMKRRKLAKESQAGVQPQASKPKLIPALLKKPKPEKDIDVREVARAQRRAEQEQEVEEQEEFRLEPGQSLPVYDVETVLIDVPAPKQREIDSTQSTNDQWDPKWNGRKNFKGFRRARDNLNGEAGSEPRRRNQTKVIVPLVDAKTSTYGMGDQYWDKTEEEKQRERDKKRKASQRTTQSQSDHSRVSHPNQSQMAHDSEEENHQDTTNGHASQMSPELARLQNEAADMLNHDIDVEEPRRTRASDTQNTSPSTGGPKRIANGIGRREAPKKQKTLPVTIVHGSDSDDSDEMKFRFGSRRRGRGRT